MARIKIDLPEAFPFSISIPVRITDLNYGNHVGNDTVLSLIHEARMQFLLQFGYTEMEFAGIGLIMADAAIEFKNELFYGETLIVSVACAGFSKVSFELYYKLEKVLQQVPSINASVSTGDKKVIVAAAKTGMVCFDYDRKKIVTIPGEARKKLQ